MNVSPVLLLLISIAIIFEDVSSTPTHSGSIGALRAGDSISKTSATTVIMHDDEKIVIGGGSINEKDRIYNSNNFDPSSTFGDLEGSSKTITNFDPRHKLAHLLHALLGLDRYPNYISRWNYNLLDDVEKLESALVEKLEKVRIQKNKLLERNERVRSIIQQHDSQHMMKEETTNEEARGDNGNDFSILSPPTTWKEVRDHILDKRAANAIFKSKMFCSTHKKSPTVQDVLDGNVSVELDAAQLEGWLDEELFDVYGFPLLSKTVSNLRLMFCADNAVLSCWDFIEYAISLVK